MCVWLTCALGCGYRRNSGQRKAPKSCTLNALKLHPLTLLILQKALKALPSLSLHRFLHLQSTDPWDNSGIVECLKHSTIKNIPLFSFFSITCPIPHFGRVMDRREVMRWEGGDEVRGDEDQSLMQDWDVIEIEVLVSLQLITSRLRFYPALRRGLNIYLLFT